MRSGVGGEPPVGQPDPDDAARNRDRYTTRQWAYRKRELDVIRAAERLTDLKAQVSSSQEFLSALAVLRAAVLTNRTTDL